MRLLRLLENWFWRVDASSGGDAEPHRGQRFSAAHPVRLGLIAGAAVGGFFGILSLIGAATGWEYAFALSTLLFYLCVAAFAGMSMMGIGYFERWRQRHYGHYPHEAGDEPDRRA
ncbi:hypothetical protein ETD86_41400 [Nonomuraea turkmeniaca]|uniref:Uncharacterized protein n=1 Tax=Nonomuraea turkmeniaca TaxID=103838 RepID=A0A5S4F1X9_9ACTN|nr:hypothetical protein [Nonomuraea turkmeniaca]TMR09977.1 hypothetical protein ETD86_41400 [Nonomuraea turkmeniaca]